MDSKIFLLGFICLGYLDVCTAIKDVPYIGQKHWCDVADKPIIMEDLTVQINKHPMNAFMQLPTFFLGLCSGSLITFKGKAKADWTFDLYYQNTDKEPIFRMSGYSCLGVVAYSNGQQQCGAGASQAIKNVAGSGGEITVQIEVKADKFEVVINGDESNKVAYTPTTPLDGSKIKYVRFYPEIEIDAIRFSQKV